MTFRTDELIDFAKARSIGDCSWRFGSAFEGATTAPMSRSNTFAKSSDRDSRRVDLKVNLTSCFEFAIADMVVVAAVSTRRPTPSYNGF
jgi:hypothetical protein